MPRDETGASWSRVDFEAFCERRYSDLLAAFTRPARAIRQEPRDVVQETITRACEWLDKIEKLGFAHELSEDDMLAWCRVVGRNYLRDLAKAGYTQLEQPHPSPTEAISDPEQQAVERADLTRVLALLPTRDAQILFLKSQGYTQEEMAALLNLKPASVGKLLQRARIAAQDGRLWQIVAALVPFGPITHAARALRRAVAKPAQVLATSIAYVSVVVAFTVPVPGNLALPAPSAHGSVVQTPLAVTGHDGAPAPTGAMSRPGSQAPSAAGAAHRPTSKPTVRGLVPHVPTTCAPHLCVASSCPGDGQKAGDRLYLKASGPCGVHTSENATPVCQYAADNPAVGCQRDGKPEWTVDPPPPPSPKGEPL